LNAAHLHLIVNHFPIVGNAVGILLLIWSLIRKRKELIQLALAFTVFVSISGFMADYTGGKAEEQVSDIPGITRTSIHDHERAADLSLYMLYATGAIGIIALVLFIRNKKPAKFFLYLTLMLSLISGYFLYRTGYLGGLIRHPEISEVMNIRDRK
jgi:hypothetical protein